MSITKDTLRNFYKKNGIGFRNVQVALRRGLEQEAHLAPLRVQCASLITRMTMQHLPVIYLDETTITTEICSKTKSWSFAAEPIPSANNTIWKSVTIIGAIGLPVKRGGIFMTMDSTNAL